MSDTNIPSDLTIPEGNSNGGKGPVKTKKLTKAEEKALAAEAETKDTVEVSKDVLEGILREIQDLKTAQKDLEKTASSDQIRKIEALRKSGKLVKEIKISNYKGKLVKSWKSTVDEVYMDPTTGKEISTQKMEITFFDDKTLELTQIDFARIKTYVKFEVLREAKTSEGNTIMTVQDESGEEFDIDTYYIN